MTKYTFRQFIMPLALSATVALSLSTVPVSADPEIEAAAKGFVENHAMEWINNPVVINAIKAQNAEHASLSQGDVDSLDKQWRKESESGTGSLIDKVLAKELSSYLMGVREDSQGLITEVFVMDNLGLNVGQSDLTSDYWQGDEAKWQKTYSVGPDAVFVDEVELDESTQRYQTQVSVSISDPVSGKVIGAVTIGIDADGLLML